MTNNQNIFNQASLAEASYANFIDTNGNLITTGQLLKDALRALNPSFSATQAAAFATKYRVVSHIPNTDSGFSATVFEEIATGKKTIAIRGTAGTTDLSADLNDIVRDGLAIDQIVDMHNYWQKLTHQNYTAKVLETDTAETIRYNSAKEGLPVILDGSLVLASTYLAWLRAQSNYVIDDNVAGVGRVRTIRNEARTDGEGLTINSVEVTGHSLGGHLAANAGCWKMLA